MSGSFFWARMDADFKNITASGMIKFLMKDHAKGG